MHFSRKDIVNMVIDVTLFIVDLRVLTKRNGKRCIIIIDKFFRI